MRVIGKYKAKEIKVLSLFVTQTYGDLLCGSRKAMNLEIIASTIGRTSIKLFGSHVPHYNADINNIDMEDYLPPETIYADLECFAPIKEGDGSRLILVWFQDSSQDPFTVAIEKLKTIHWEKHAEDYEI